MPKFSIPSLVFSACLLALLSACSTAPTHPSLHAQSPALGELGPLVPVHKFVANLDGHGAYQISPDGQKLLWAARKGLGPGLYVKNLQTGAVQSVNVPGVASWAQDSRHVLFHKDSGGDENTHVYMADTEAPNAAPKDLTPFAGAKSSILATIQESDDLLIVSNQRDAKVFDLYRYAASTGKMDVIAQNPGDVAEWLPDQHGAVLGRVRKQGERWVYETPPAHIQEAWRSVFDVNFFDSVQPLEVAADGSFVWALSNRGRDKIALVKIDLATGEEHVVHADARVDVSYAHISSTTNKPTILTLEPDYQEIKVMDSRFQAAIEKLQGAGHSRVELGSFSRDETLFTATVIRQGSEQHVLYDMAKNQFTVLGEDTRSRLHAFSPLPEQRPITLQSRDGLPLHGYLTLPYGVEAKKLPTVLYVHGGPWARDTWLNGDPMVPFLANRGYAVLQVNYRGSSGYGRIFQEAAQGEFAGKMHTDLLDGVDYLVQQGITDPRKVAIMGASYGGYASLVGMTFTPERFACGISFVGMSDLASLVENAPPYWELSKPLWTKYVGDPNKPADRAVMNSKSPLYLADKVQAPLLILHGANDARVKLDQSTRMVDALTLAGKKVDFYVFNNAGHGVHSWSNRLTYFRKTEDFLAQCLGGRSNGFDYYQLASWAL